MNKIVSVRTPKPKNKTPKDIRKITNEQIVENKAFKDNMQYLSFLLNIKRSISPNDILQKIPSKLLQSGQTGKEYIFKKEPTDFENVSKFSPLFRQNVKNALFDLNGLIAEFKTKFQKQKNTFFEIKKHNDIGLTLYNNIQKSKSSSNIFNKIQNNTAEKLDSRIISDQLNNKKNLQLFGDINVEQKYYNLFKLDPLLIRNKKEIKLFSICKEPDYMKDLLNDKTIRYMNRIKEYLDYLELINDKKLSQGLRDCLKNQMDEQNEEEKDNKNKNNNNIFFISKLKKKKEEKRNYSQECEAHKMSIKYTKNTLKALKDNPKMFEEDLGRLTSYETNFSLTKAENSRNESIKKFRETALSRNSLFKLGSNTTYKEHKNNLNKEEHNPILVKKLKFEGLKDEQKRNNMNNIQLNLPKSVSGLKRFNGFSTNRSVKNKHNKSTNYTNFYKTYSKDNKDIKKVIISDNNKIKKKLEKIVPKNNRITPLNIENENIRNKLYLLRKKARKLSLNVPSNSFNNQDKTNNFFNRSLNINNKVLEKYKNENNSSAFNSIFSKTHLLKNNQLKRYESTESLKISENDVIEAYNKSIEKPFFSNEKLKYLTKYFDDKGIVTNIKPEKLIKKVKNIITEYSIEDKIKKMKGVKINLHEFKKLNNISKIDNQLREMDKTYFKEMLKVKIKLSKEDDDKYDEDDLYDINT